MSKLSRRLFLREYGIPVLGLSIGFATAGVWDYWSSSAEKSENSKRVRDIVSYVVGSANVKDPAPAIPPEESDRLFILAITDNFRAAADVALYRFLNQPKFSDYLYRAENYPSNSFESIDITAINSHPRPNPIKLDEKELDFIINAMAEKSVVLDKSAKLDTHGTLAKNVFPHPEKLEAVISFHHPADRLFLELDGIEGRVVQADLVFSRGGHVVWSGAINFANKKTLVPK